MKNEKISTTKNSSHCVNKQAFKNIKFLNIDYDRKKLNSLDAKFAIYEYLFNKN